MHIAAVFLHPQFTAEGVALGLSGLYIFGFGIVVPLLHLLDFKHCIDFSNFIVLSPIKTVGRQAAGKPERALRSWRWCEFSL